MEVQKFVEALGRKIINSQNSRSHSNTMSIASS